MGAGTVEKVGMSFSAALDQEVCDALDPQVLEEPRQVDAIVMAGSSDDRGTVLERLDASTGRSIGDDHARERAEGVGQDLGIERSSGSRIEHDAKASEGFSSIQVAGTYRQRWVVGDDGVDAHQDGVGGSAEAHGELATGRAGDPLRFAAGGSDLAVHGHGGFDGDEGRLMYDPVIERFVQLVRFPFQNARSDLDAGAAEDFKTASGMDWVWVGGCDHDPSDPGLTNCVGARRGSAMGTAGFECDIKGCTPGGMTLLGGIA